MTTIYNYHPQTGEFVSASVADESPLEPGVIIVPAYATPLVPPDVGNHQVQVFGNESWSIKADWRGVALYSPADGSAVVISEIGVTPQDVSATDSPRPGPAYSWVDSAWTLDSALVSAQLAAARSARWEAIKVERDRRIQSGGYKVGGKWFHSDTFSRTQQMGLVMLAANIPTNTLWKTMDGTTVTMTQALAGQILATAAASDIAIFAAAETHKAAMEASADPASYDYSTGWPKIYGE